MSLNRREFMWTCGGTVVALTAGAGPRPRGMAAERKIWMIPELNKELFEKHVGETFLVAPEEGPYVPLRLAKVVDTTAAAQSGKVYTESFTVQFEGAPDQPLMQGLHTFKHEGMGETTLFMAPVVSRNPELRRYEVVFNRLVKS